MPPRELRTPDLERLLEAVLSLSDPETAYRFFEDLCTPRELAEMAQRFTVASMLIEGANYAAVQERTHASATTIARVSKALNYGTGGYRDVIDARVVPGDDTEQDGVR